MGRSASSREKRNSAQGRWGAGAETTVSDLPGPGTAGCPRGPSLTPNTSPRGAAHLRHGSSLHHQRVRSRRLSHPLPPCGHPQPRKGQTVPESDVAGWSGAQRRGKCRVGGGACETAPEPRPPQRGEQEERRGDSEGVGKGGKLQPGGPPRSYFSKSLRLIGDNHTNINAHTQTRAR